MVVHSSIIPADHTCVCLFLQAENSALSIENDNQRKQYERCLDEVSMNESPADFHILFSILFHYPGFICHTKVAFVHMDMSVFYLFSF